VSWAALVAQLDVTLVEHFGEPTTYTPATGAPVSLSGIFDAAYVRAAAGEAGVSSVAPAVFYTLADLPVDPEDDDPEITIGDRTYRVIETKKDGQGGVLLLLHRER
jgi:hypothetical protein